MGEERKRHVGRIRISSKLLLEWLQFPEGRLLGIYQNDIETFGVFDVLIEDDEMPSLSDGACVPIVTPSYITEYNDRGVQVNVTREPLNNKEK